MGSVSKSHHFVPQFYLAGFTDSGDSTGYLWEHDMKRDASPRKTHPKGTGFENHLYRVTAPGVEADFIEQRLSRVESRAKEVLEKLHRLRALPPQGNPAYRILMVYVTLMIVRVPRIRSYVIHLVEEILSGRIAEIPRDRQVWQEVVRGTDFESLENHLDVDARTPLEEARGSRKVTNLFIKYMLMLFKDLFPWVQRRKWTLWITDSPSDLFITSDQPAALLATSPGQRLTGRGGYDNAKTALVMPISRSMALEGRFEIGRGTAVADQDMVALLNGIVGGNASRFVYSAREEFAWGNSWDGSKVRIRDSTAFREAWKIGDAQREEAMKASRKAKGT